VVLLRGWYEPTLERALAAPRTVAVAAAGLVLIAAAVTTRMGGEFMPSLDEGDYALHALRIPGTSLTQSVAMQEQLERRIKKLPFVEFVFSKVGTADVANDPMPPSVADTFIILKPRDEWSNPRTSQAQIIAEIQKAIAEVPGNNYELTQPIQMRFNELMTGVRSDVAIKVFGDDIDTGLGVAERIGAIAAQIEGADDVTVEQVTGLPMLVVDPDRAALAR
jgi:cobalt-zinc-cadmium resistance protein CzcA